MAKTAMLALRVSPEIRQGLDKAAAEGERTVSWLVERILREWLTKKGYLARCPE
jgi:hypothetical protein